MATEIRAMARSGLHYGVWSFERTSRDGDSQRRIVRIQYSLSKSMKARSCHEAEDEAVCYLESRSSAVLET